MTGNFKTFEWYDPAVGDNLTFERRASGAYIFRPAPNSSTNSLGEPQSVSVHSGHGLANSYY